MFRDNTFKITVISPRGQWVNQALCLEIITCDAVDILIHREMVPFRYLSGKLWYLQHNCVGDNIVFTAKTEICTMENSVWEYSWYVMAGLDIYKNLLAQTGNLKSSGPPLNRSYPTNTSNWKNVWKCNEIWQFSNWPNSWNSCCPHAISCCPGHLGLWSCEGLHGWSHSHKPCFGKHPILGHGNIKEELSTWKKEPMISENEMTEKLLQECLAMSYMRCKIRACFDYFIPQLHDIWAWIPRMRMYHVVIETGTFLGKEHSRDKRRSGIYVLLVL